MAWQCKRCGERLDDSFTACWRCAGEDPAASRVGRDEDFADQDEIEFDDSGEIAAQQAEETFDYQVWAYKRAMGWYPANAGDRGVALGNSLHRLVTAYRLYRERQERTTGARPDLDRLWLQFFLALGLLGGVWLGFLTSSAWRELLMASDVRLGVIYGGTLLLAFATGMRVVGRELRAAAETAVRQGWRAPVT